MSLMTAPPAFAENQGILDSTFGATESVPGIVPMPASGQAFRGAFQSNGSLVVELQFTRRELVRVDANGHRDLSFGTGGVVDLNVPNYGLIRDVDVDTSDRIVVTLDSAVVRLLPNGGIDPQWTFDLVMDSNNFWQLSDAVIDAAGRLLVTGTYKMESQPMIARLTTTGGLDESFAAAGDVPGRKLLFAFPQRDPILGPDGAIYLVGQSTYVAPPQFLTVEKVSETGVADSTFGTGNPVPGVVGLHPGQTSIGLSAALDGVGRLLVVGNSSALNGTSNQSTIVRLLANGDVDPSYSAASAAANMRFPRKVSLLENGDAVIVGSFIAGQNFADVPGAMVLSSSGDESVRTGWAHVGNHARIPSLTGTTIQDSIRDTQGRILFLTDAGVARVKAPTVLGFTGVDPGRLLDTRPDGATIDGEFQRSGIVKAGTTVAFTVAGRAGVAANATAASLNVTVTEPAAAGFVTVYPCGSTRPLASNLNYTTAQTIPNAVLTKIGDNGTVCAYTTVDAHLIADINGYFMR